MNAQLNGPVARLVRANGCDESELTATEPEVIAERNALREVTLPKVNPPTSVLKITPEVRAMAAKTSEFAVDNTQGSEAYEVIVDGESVGTVEPGSKLSHLTIAAGYHNICFRGLDKDCRVGSDRGRNVPFHDGLRILIRRGAGPELIVPEGEG